MVFPYFMAGQNEATPKVIDLILFLYTTKRYVSRTNQGTEGKKHDVQHLPGPYMAHSKTHYCLMTAQRLGHQCGLSWN